jgi:hypothetical protein
MHVLSGEHDVRLGGLHSKISRGFCLQGEVGEKDSRLSFEEEAHIFEVLQSFKTEDTQVFGLVETEQPSENPLAEKLREKLFEDFKDSVFRDKIFPNPQPRGPHGMANIKLKSGSVPKYIRAIPCHGEKLEYFRKALDKWKSLSKLEPPEPSGWGSAMFLVPKNKPEDPFRPVIDLRAPNAAAEVDSYTIPLIDDILTRQGRKHMWTKLDLMDAFSQIPLAPEARPIFKITTPLGDFQPTIMLQGYANAPSIFQREMDFCLDPVSNIANAYFDDIICGTEKFKEDSEEDLLLRQDKEVRQVLELLKKGISKNVCFSPKRWNFVDTCSKGAQGEFHPGGSLRWKSGPFQKMSHLCVVSWGMSTIFSNTSVNFRSWLPPFKKN